MRPSGPQRESRHARVPQTAPLMGAPLPAESPAGSLDCAHTSNVGKLVRVCRIASGGMGRAPPSSKGSKRSALMIGREGPSPWRRSRPPSRSAFAPDPAPFSACRDRQRTPTVRGGHFAGSLVQFCHGRHAQHFSSTIVAVHTSPPCRRHLMQPGWPHVHIVCPPL